MKKLICVLLVLAVCLGMGASALADGGVELPDVTQFLSEWLEDYGVTVELVKQDDFGTMIGIENVQDMQTVLDETRFGIGRLLRLNDFDLVSGPDTEAGELLGEYLYAYTGSASVGTVEDSTGMEGNVYVYLYDDGDFVNGITVVIMMGDGISMKSSDADTAAGTDASDTGADNILPDAWAFFNEEITHSDKLVTNGKTAHFGLAAEDRQACYEYIDLLLSGRFGITLTETWEKSVGAGKSIYYVFDYPGTGEDMEITREIDDRDVSGDLIVQIDDWRDVSWCDLLVRFSDALTVVDTGDRCTITGLREWGHIHSTGPMGSAVSDPDIPYPDIPDPDDDYTPPPKPETKCYKCHGDGKVECSQCDGDGGKWVYDSVPNYDGDGNTTVRTWESCFKCHGTGEMTCPNCGGSGKG